MGQGEGGTRAAAPLLLGGVSGWSRPGPQVAGESGPRPDMTGGGGREEQAQCGSGGSSGGREGKEQAQHSSGGRVGWKRRSGPVAGEGSSGPDPAAVAMTGWGRSRPAVGEGKQQA